MKAAWICLDDVPLAADYRCPECGSEPGQQCSRPDGTEVAWGVHEARVEPRCVGGDEGCGFYGEAPGGVCPRCNGLVLSAASEQEAAALARRWRAEDRRA